MRGPHTQLWPAAGHQQPRPTHKQRWLLRSDQAYDPNLPSMVLTKEDLLAHSRYIRDTLAPRIAKGNNPVSGKDAFDLTNLRSALEELHKSPVTLEILSFSRIEKALQKIVEAHGGDWPPDIVTKAKDLIARWDESFGLQRVRTDLWGQGGPLEDFAQPGGWFRKGHTALPSAENPARELEVKCNLGRAHQDGHSDFNIGDWWLNSAAACRDGIVDNPFYRISSDEDVAYAIAMTQQMETNVANDGSCSYTPLSTDPGVFKLMATINGGQRTSVRVLRSWRLQSPLAPVGGIRYDGLYRVTSYGVKLSYNPATDSDVWHYTFHLQREPGQDSLEKALCHPSSDQLDDWEDYREDMWEGILAQDQEPPVLGFEGKQRLQSIDSGYFSPNPAEQGVLKS